MSLDAPAPDRLRLAASGVLPWLEQAVAEGASDLFLSVGEPPILKVRGLLRRLGEERLTSAQVAAAVECVLLPAKQQRFDRGEDVDEGVTVRGLGRFRVNVFRERKGSAIALRPLPDRVPPLRELGLPSVLEELSHLTRGLMLVTGPAGSGKTTTLASLVELINGRDERHIITIEDPIEYVIPSRRCLVHQRELGVDTPSFAEGLRSAMREHPDIMVVGELRDLDSISLGIRAAETGHLVLATLHSGSAVQAITRILDVFPAELQNQIRVQLAQSLQAIIAQRLLPRRDGSGMVAATEVLIATPAVCNLIRRNRLEEVPTYLEAGRGTGMHTMRQSLAELLARGVIDAQAQRDSDAGELTFARRRGAPPA